MRETTALTNEIVTRRKTALSSDDRAALTLRYVGGLSVPEVAHHLRRSVHATEALLVRARGAFRQAYERGRAVMSDQDAPRELVCIR